MKQKTRAERKISALFLWQGLEVRRKGRIGLEWKNNRAKDRYSKGFRRIILNSLNTYPNIEFNVIIVINGKRNTWEIPGGHREENETIESTA